MAIELYTKVRAWRREHLRPNGAHQVAEAWINGSRPIELQIPLPTRHHEMKFGWQERARRLAEKKLNEAAEPFGPVLTLSLDEVDDGI